MRFIFQNYIHIWNRLLIFTSIISGLSRFLPQIITAFINKECGSLSFKSFILQTLTGWTTFYIIYTQTSIIVWIPFCIRLILQTFNTIQYIYYKFQNRNKYIIIN